MTGASFKFEREGWLVMLRLLLGFVAISLSIVHQIILASILLVLCVWLDAGTGWYFRRHGPKASSVTALECYVDFICFVGAPIVLTYALAPPYFVLIFLPIFLLAAVYRLARFQVEGLIEGGYLGLPVTYNGYLFPMAAFTVHFYPSAAATILPFLLLASSLLMISRRFKIPEV